MGWLGQSSSDASSNDMPDEPARKSLLSSVMETSIFPGEASTPPPQQPQFLSSDTSTATARASTTDFQNNNNINNSMHPFNFVQDVVASFLLLVLLQLANRFLPHVRRRKRASKTTKIGNRPPPIPPPRQTHKRSSSTNTATSTCASSTTTLRGQNWTITPGKKNTNSFPIVFNFADGTVEECLEQLEGLQMESESEVVDLLIKCCSQEQVYFANYGIVAADLCRRRRRGGGSGLGSGWKWGQAFAKKFAQFYHKESKKPRKIRHVAMLFAHLLATDSICWNDVMQNVRLNDYETTPSSRLFLKTLLLSLASEMGGIHALQSRISKEPSCSGLLPTNNLRNARYAIQFLTAIGLPELTVELKKKIQQTKTSAEEETMSSSSSYSSMNSASFHSTEHHHHHHHQNAQRLYPIDSLRSERSQSSRGTFASAGSPSIKTHRQRALQSILSVSSSSTTASATPLSSPAVRLSLSDGSHSSSTTAATMDDVAFPASSVLTPPALRSRSKSASSNEDEDDNNDIVSEQEEKEDISLFLEDRITELPASLPLLVEEEENESSSTGATAPTPATRNVLFRKRVSIVK
eukprot:scaffold2428_cov97-Cylindrotheca_fusiformis.AAC.7